jgi:uncharacterized membrane protein
MRVELPLSRQFHSVTTTMRPPERLSLRLGHVVLALTTANALLLLYLLVDHRGELAGSLFRSYGGICHQGDWIHLFGTPVALPLCYRCMGIHLFLFLGGWLYVLAIAGRNRKVSFRLFLLLVSPMVVDALFGISTQMQSGILAFLTGSLFGLGCIISILQGLRAR